MVVREQVGVIDDLGADTTLVRAISLSRMTALLTSCGNRPRLIHKLCAQIAGIMSAS